MKFALKIAKKTILRDRIFMIRFFDCEFREKKNGHLFAKTYKNLTAWLITTKSPIHRNEDILH